MSDEDLRALERAAQDPASRIRYAEALLRLGRVSDAVSALIPAADDVEVRRRIGRLEAPSVPVVKKPRVVWRSEVLGAPVMFLHASPLGLLTAGWATVATEQAWGPNRACVLDAETGARRPFEPAGRPLGIYGHVALSLTTVARRQGFTANDIVTGEYLWAFEQEVEHLGVGLRRVRVVVDGRVTELAWPTAERPPRPCEPDEEVAVPIKAPESGVTFDTPEVVYGVMNGDLLYARAKSTRARLWSLQLPGVRAVVAVRHRLYAVAGPEVVCLE